jgi:autotransporter strand-loop-strand O-heptosyltransferase
MIYDNIQRNMKMVQESAPTFTVSFSEGARIDITDASPDKMFRVEFWDNRLNEKVFETKIKTGMFASTNKRYFIEWKINVYENDDLVYSYVLNLNEKRVFVMLDSKSLGDNIAWFPAAYEFSKINSCKLVCCTFFNFLFEKEYPDVEWIKPGSSYNACFANYTLGYFYGEDRFLYTPVDPRTSPLQKVAADILGIPYEETRPRIVNTLVRTAKNYRKKKYVCIAIHSTAKAKYWLRENGWQDLVDYIKMRGYDVVVIHRENNDLKGVIDDSGDYPLEKRIESLSGCEAFIGVGSGLSWLAWALKKPVVLISGFSAPFAEFQKDCYRVHNSSVCNSCWNDTSIKFDKGDFNWCPRLKDTKDQFVCSKSISVISVIDALEKALQAQL